MEHKAIYLKYLVSLEGIIYIRNEYGIYCRGWRYLVSERALKKSQQIEEVLAKVCYSQVSDQNSNPKETKKR